MKKISILLCALLSTGLSFAQNAEHLTFKGTPHCGFEDVLRKTQVPYATLLQAYKDAAATSPSATLAKTTGVVYDVPVVFHIVYSTQTPSLNITDAIVQGQVDIMNKAFRNTHADTGDTRTIFKPLAGDAEIVFHLATADPQGNATTGITRTESVLTYFGSTDGSLDSLERMKHTATGGHDAWPTAKYLNIWVGNMADSAGELSVLGYGIPPLNPIPSTWPVGSEFGLNGLVDGVMLQTNVVGINPPLAAAINNIYSKGRAAVHEVGHYLGLQHVFGSNGGGQASCGAIADDGMADTPEQSEISFTSSSCPSATKNTCGVGVSGDQPDMWENYMDYSRDACQTLFTHDQISLIRGVLDVQRSTLAVPTSINEIPANASFALYPNPAVNQLSVPIAGKVSQVDILNIMGQKLVHFEGAAAASKSYDVTALPSGYYIIQITVDGKLLNSRFTVAK